MLFILVDCGTTNMRCKLIDSKTMDELGISKRKAGVRNTAFTGSNRFLKDALRDCIAELLEKTGKTEQDVRVVILCGTLSSNVGIYHVHHVATPAGARETAAAAQTVTLPEITGIPLFFIPGIKTLPDSETERRGDLNGILDHLDSMSGEECETYGIMEQLGRKGGFTVCLPGSYNKTFRVDGEGRIVSMSTGMCGEHMTALAEHTLLGHTLPKPIVRTLIPQKITEGYEYARLRGVSPALVKSRMLVTGHGCTPDEAGNFFAGAALYADIQITIGECEPGKPVIVGGSSPLRDIFCLLLRHAGCPASEVIDAGDKVSERAPVYGGWKVYRLRNGEDD